MTEMSSAAEPGPSMTRGRRQRTRQTMIETAFVSSSSTVSSCEDLEEVDRIANHPVLRVAADSGPGSGMRRSRSEMGGSVDRGVSSLLARSPVSVSGAGRELGRGLSRSTTTCSHLAQAARPGHFTSPALSLQPRHRPSIRSRVAALISGAVSPRQCVTPPPGPRQQHRPAPATPPNTAPLPKKVRSPGAGAGLTCSHSASSGVDHGSSSGLGLARLSQLGTAASVSSSDSLAPAQQRSHWSENQIRNREFVKTNCGQSDPATPHGTAEAARPSSPAPPPALRRPAPALYRRMAGSGCSSLLSSMESVESNTSEGGSTSGSLTSGVASSSVSLQDSVAGHVSSTRVSRIISKLNILSPISDKSQEQTSSPSEGKSPQDPDPGAPSPHLHPASAPGRNKKRNLDLNLNLNFSEGNQDNGHTISFKTLRTPDIQQYLNVPWDIPKLKSKLKNRRNCFRGQSSSPEMSPKKVVMKKSPDVEVILSEGRVKTPGGKTDQTQPSKHLNIKFEDYSEVKCNQTSSVKTPELEKFLEVPWEVPKLRKKIANRRKMKTLVNLQGSDSGISMSSQETAWPGPSGSCRRRSQVYLTQSQSQERSQEQQEEVRSSGSRSPDNPPPPTTLACSSVPANSEFLFHPPPSSHSAGARAVTDYSPSPRPGAGAPPLGLQEPGGDASRVEPGTSDTCDSNTGGSTPTPTPTPIHPAPSTAEDMKTRDLTLAMPPSLHPPPSASSPPLPFSMPKLERRMRQPPGAGLSLQLPRQQSSLNLSLAAPNNNNNSSSSSSKQLRPVSLHASTPSQAAISQLKLPLQGPEPSPAVAKAGSSRKPLLFISPQLNLAASVAVDTSLPLEAQEWYHGVISRHQAEAALKPHSEGSYLLRATLDTGHSIALKSARGFMHLRVSRVDAGENTSYRLGEFDKTFSSIVGMVHHYTINRLPIKGAEHMCLLTPVTEELL